MTPATTSIFEMASSGNIFADLGFGPGEAEMLTAKTALTLAMKGVMPDPALTQKQAAKVCGTDQPTLSKVLQGRMEDITLDCLAHWLTAFGQDMELATSGRRHSEQVPQ